MNTYILAIFLASVFIAAMTYSSLAPSFAQNQTGGEDGGGPITGLTNQAQDVFNGTNQTGGPLAQLGQSVQETFK
jgi:hypothetical protein